MRIGIQGGLSLLLTLASGAAFGDFAGGKHDFSREAWSGGKTCAVCHLSHLRSLRKFPAEASPGALVLSAEEKAAIRANPANRLCLQCHRPKDGSDRGGHSPIDSGKGLAGPAQPPAFGSGSRASVCLRINSQGSIAGKDCVSCHDIHASTSPFLLRADYPQAAGNP
ncbi:MAG: cytochrome c3 family protein [Oligoflexia bacterium]|nr:cytochrome c3 family protein [Oligoflexia bacterium]